MINRNMRCIEMAVGTSSTWHKLLINRNMRCIEIIEVLTVVRFIP